MKVGFIGLGKLGLPVAACLGQVHRVVGYDIDPAKMQHHEYPHREMGLGSETFQSFYDMSDLHYGPLNYMSDCKIIFVAVQTPHEPAYEGTTLLTQPPKDFDYTYLAKAVADLAPHVSKDQIVVVISTCLPGTIRRHVMPSLEGRCSLVYNPFFIAMGTVVRDFARPEFVLLGGDDKAAVQKVERFYRDFYDRWKTGFGADSYAIPPFAVMSIESAELTKVLYNTHISNKIVLSSYAMEMCHKIKGCDVDDVTGAMKLATERILGPRYMDGGLPDSGGCHPRDAIAMSWLGEAIGLSYDPCRAVSKARELQAGWLAELIINRHRDDLPVVLLGKAYKPESNLMTGSSALLIADILMKRRVTFTHWDPHVDGPALLHSRPALYFIATKHDAFRSLSFPQGSVIIDPFRYIGEQPGVRIIGIGKNR